MMFEERPVTFDCGGAQLLGILCVPEGMPSTAVVIVVGGPQCRTGSHRQFTLLAKEVAENGIVSLRFDHRGIGDSEGEPRSFDSIDEDIKAALDLVYRHTPSVTKAVLWGLCDAASAACMYAGGDPRVAGCVLLNPWVRSAETLDHARVRFYYLARLVEADFWRKIYRGELRWIESLKEFSATVWRFFRSGFSRRNGKDLRGGRGFVERMLDGLLASRGKFLFVLSGNDITAREFETLIGRQHEWSQFMRGENISLRRVESATHTFSRADWRREVLDHTLQFIRSL